MATGLKRGPLKVVSPLHPVKDALKGTAAAAVSPLAPLKPSGIADDVKLSKLWDEIVPELDKAGVLSTADVMSVELALRHFSAARMAYETLMEEGSTLQVRGPKDEDDETDYGTKRNPAELVFRLESAAYLQYAQQLGMTFVARARTAMPKGDEGAANPFSASGS